ncbi:tyrosine-type recombinase/integrase [Aliarcobacter butzleri]|uniref:tyrosine-type recombinase/integrase n=1 Tax=Aliarcobacter butzleri TaxID=28197 RepID=UPI001EDA6906|nr:site-specific integrase [Aliarcobacter butzleri]MCG3676213.1 site-specific integrase [Aliarcobacter butzleri]MDN5124734.1 tyrosine-type recombinase/integrase [Aliarcobacter butzleri]
MGFRKIRAKKYSGIYEYFKDSDNDKTTIAYYISYRDIDNKIKKVKCNATSKDDALKILNDKRAELTKDRNEIKKDATLLNRKIMNNNLTLEDVAKLYFPTKIAASIDMITSDYYRQINPILGKMKISKIKTEDVKNLSDTLKEKKSRLGTLFNPRTVKKTITSLRALFNWAIKQGYVEKNPVIVKEIIKVDRNEPGRVLSDEELFKLWNLDEFIIKPRLFLFLKACYHTGARPSAVMDIQVKHINFVKGTVHIRAMKQGKPYDARVGKELLDLFKNWINEHHLIHDNFIFYPQQLYKRAITKDEKEALKNQSTRYQKYAEQLRKIFDKHFNQNIGTYDLAYRVSVYTMRRTAATNIYKKFGIVHAKRFLNHTEIDTTMKYLNIDDDMEVIDYGL